MSEVYRCTGHFNLPRRILRSGFYRFVNTKWHISVDLSKDRKFLTVTIDNNNESNLQSFESNIKINLKYGEGKNLEKTFDSVHFDYKHNVFCIDNFISIQELKKHDVMDNFVIDVCFNFTYIAGNRKTSDEIDFCDKRSTFNDVVLKFDSDSDSEKILYASRAMLSINSKVFHRMFNSDFKESNDKIVKLDDNFEEFEMLLRAIYPSKIGLHRGNIEILMKLADKYDMPILMDRCVDYVEVSNDIPIDVKFLMADKFTLSHIHNDCIRGFHDIKSLENFHESKHFENLTDETKLAVLKRTFKVLGDAESGEPSAKTPRTILQMATWDDLLTFW